MEKVSLCSKVVAAVWEAHQVSMWNHKKKHPLKGKTLKYIFLEFHGLSRL